MKDKTIELDLQKMDIQEQLKEIKDKKMMINFFLREKENSLLDL